MASTSCPQESKSVPFLKLAPQRCRRLRAASDIAPALGHHAHPGTGHRDWAPTPPARHSPARHGPARPSPAAATTKRGGRLPPAPPSEGGCAGRARDIATGAAAPARGWGSAAPGRHRHRAPAPARAGTAPLRSSPPPQGPQALASFHTSDLTQTTLQSENDSLVPSQPFEGYSSRPLQFLRGSHHSSCIKDLQ